MIAGVRGRWRSVLGHPILRLELRRIRRKRWWPGRRFFMFYPALLGAVLGCGLMLALTDSLGVQAAALVTGVPFVCLVGVVASLLSFALPWIAPALTAATIAREREAGTLDLLRATLLTERSIVLGKLGGCLARLWPGILTLALLTPFHLIWSTGSGVSLFGPLYIPVLMVGPTFDVGRAWMWLLVAGVAESFKPWGDLAFHAAVGMFVSALSRSSGMAVAASYAAILVARVVLWLVASLLPSLLLFVLFVDSMDSIDMMAASLDYTLLASGLTSLTIVLVEVAGAILLMWGAVWWLKRV